MQSGAYMDLAQVTLYVFWIFFACLIFYLRREDKREGYPLDSTASGGGVVHGFPRMPDPKNYLLRTGHVATLPNHKNDRRDVAVAPIAVWPGAPMEPTGNAMRATASITADDRSHVRAQASIARVYSQPGCQRNDSSTSSSRGAPSRRWSKAHFVAECPITTIRLSGYLGARSARKLRARATTST